MKSHTKKNNDIGNYIIDIEIIRRKRRDELDLMYSLLVSALDPVYKTNLANDTFMNAHQIKKYIPWLVRLGFLEEKNDGKGGVLYKTSSDGKSFIRAFFDYSTTIDKKEFSTKRLYDMLS
jgi:predicted transcriptional regulator